jgi:hypothetical protein
MAVAEVASVYCAPVKVPGGKPVTAVPGLTPRFPVNAVAPVLVTVEPARTTNVEAEARDGESCAPDAAEVVKVHAMLLVMALPAASFAPVVTVAVYAVLATRALVGVNVAVLVDATYVTVPGTGVAPGPVTEKVVDEIVEAAIGSLNVAVMTATPVAPLRGFVDVTVGAVLSPIGDTGSSLPHPAETARSMGSARAAKRVIRGFIGGPPLA